jgi:hypothetical protein
MEVPPSCSRYLHNKLTHLSCQQMHPCERSLFIQMINFNSSIGNAHVLFIFLQPQKCAHLFSPSTSAQIGEN